MVKDGYQSIVQEVYDLLVVQKLTDEEIVAKVTTPHHPVRLEYVQWARKFYMDKEPVKEN